jgi:hypothetical protein
MKDPSAWAPVMCKFCFDEEERQLLRRFWTGICTKSQTYMSRWLGKTARTIT